MAICRRKIALQRLYTILAHADAKAINLTQAYCVKCKAKREMKTPQNIVMKNGKKAVQGICPVCGTKLFRIGG